MSTTPIETATDVLAGKLYPGLDVGQVTRDYLSDTVRAVFESIDRGALAKAHYEAYRVANPGTLTWDTEFEGVKARFFRRADVSIAHLLAEGGE